MRLSSQILIAIFFWLAVSVLSPQVLPLAQVTPRNAASGGAFTGHAEPWHALPAASSRRITLAVVVTDLSGKLVSGLQPQDFTVLDEKKPQTIQSFGEAVGTGANADAPARALVVIDAVNNSETQVAFQREQVAKFLRQGGGELPLPTSLALVADKHQDQSPYTRDRNILLAVLNSLPSTTRIHHREQGIYGQAERTSISLQVLINLVGAQTVEPGRTLLIWLGEGWPYLEGNNVKLSRDSEGLIFRHTVWLSTQLRERHITLYNVDGIRTYRTLGRAFYYQQFLKGVDSAQKIQPGNVTLQVLSVQSGGLVLNRSNDLADSISACLADAGDYYLLAFDEPPAGHADQHHSLQIKIARPELTARTRIGYYAQP